MSEGVRVALSTAQQAGAIMERQTRKPTELSEPTEEYAELGEVTPARDRTARSTRHAQRNAKIKKMWAGGEGLDYVSIGEYFKISPARVNEIVHDPRSTNPPLPPKKVFDSPAMNQELADRARTMKEMWGNGDNVVYVERELDDGTKETVEVRVTLQYIANKFGLTRARVQQIISNPNSHVVKPRKEKPTTKGTPGRDRWQTNVVDGARHGTIQGYFSDDCRCDDCYNAYREDYVAKREAAGLPEPKQGYRRDREIGLSDNEGGGSNGGTGGATEAKEEDVIRFAHGDEPASDYEHVG